VIELLAFIAVDYAGGSADTIGKECHECLKDSVKDSSVQ
jgi:hypothetical protein